MKQMTGEKLINNLHNLLKTSKFKLYLDNGYMLEIFNNKNFKQITASIINDIKKLPQQGGSDDSLGSGGDEVECPFFPTLVMIVVLAWMYGIIVDVGDGKPFHGLSYL